MAEVLRDMERARMTAEDCRGAMVSPYGTPGHTTDPRRRFYSWKEFGKARNDRCDHVTFNVIEPAREALYQVCRDMQTKLEARGSPYEALVTAHNDICRIQSILREDEGRGR